MSKDVSELNLSYDFEPSRITDNSVFNELMNARTGLMKEIIETFGVDMGPVNFKRTYNTTFDTAQFEAQDLLSNESVLPKKNKDSLMIGILRFANALGLNNSGGDGRWAQAVVEMAEWYVNNVHTYSQTTTAPCPLVNKNVRYDCSGFITACLWHYGALLDYPGIPSSAAFTNDDVLAKKLEEAGFEKLTFSWDTVQPFDIISFSGHVEIYNGLKDGKHSSYAWGSCHDASHGGLPCGTAHIKQGYDVIWRNRYNGGGTSSISQVNMHISSGQTKINALKVISMLMNDLGLTKAQAAGIAGVLTAESNVNPHIFNKGEKNGTYKASGANNEGAPYGHKHSPWSYGAGIVQWTFTDRKEKAIMGGLGMSREQAVNIITHGGIESLSLEQQVKMLEYELNTTYKYTLAAIKKCTTAQQAAATYYVRAVAGYSTSTAPVTQAEINKKNAAYAKVGGNSQINKGMGFAEGYMKA